MTARTPEELKAWEHGRKHGERTLAHQMFEAACSDKLEFLQKLFQISSLLAKDNKHVTDEVERQKWEAYSEGVRHALNIINCHADPAKTYETIIANSMPMPSTIDLSEKTHKIMYEQF